MSLVAGSILVELDALDKGFKKGMREAGDEVVGFEDRTKKSSNKVKDVGSSMLNGLGGVVQTASLAMGAGFLTFGAGVLKSTSDAQTLNIALKSALGGSEEAANNAQETIGKFAAKTPYDLQQVTESFIKLKNLGLSPSEEALTAYGNTASSMGKPLMQMIEAVADASTGEFERLKEFGIKSSKEGDKVKFTFQGVTTTVKNNSGEIQKYLMDIGNTKFAGAMDEQSRSIAGTMSTLQDSISQKMVAIGKVLKIDSTLPQIIQGLSDVVANIDIQPFVTALTAGVDGLTQLSNWMVANSQIVITGLGGVASAILYLVVPAMWANATAMWASATATWAAIAPLLPFIALAVLVGAGVTALGLLIYNNWGNIKTWTQTTFTSITSWISTTWSSISTGTTGFLSWFGGAINDKWDWITNLTTNIWQGISTFFTAFWETLKVVVSTAFLIVVGLFTGNWELIGQATKGFSGKMGEIWGQMWENLKLALATAILNMVISVARWWEDTQTSSQVGVENFKKALSNAWDSIAKGAKEGWDNVGKAIDGVINWIKGINMGEIGKNMIQGLIDGVKSMAGSLTDTLKNLVNSAINAAKQALGIQSPSRVFMEIGDFTMQGLEKGIDINSDLPINAVNRVTTDMISTAGYDPTSTETTNRQTTSMPTIQIQGDLVVREEADINRIATELFRMIQQTA